MMNTGKLCLTLLVISGFLPFSLSVLAKDDIKLSGLIMVDYDNFDGDLVEHSDQGDSSLDIRRARLALKSSFNHDWKSKLQLDFSQSKAEIKDAYMRYKGWDLANITIGKQKEPFGLENQISSRNLPMIERSIVSEAFSAGRSIGIQLNGEMAQLNWQLGVFKPENSAENAAVTGRISWQAYQDYDQYLHLGASYSQRDYSNYDFRLNETLEVDFADSLFEGDHLTLDNTRMQGVEAIWAKGGFTATAEWQQAKMSEQNASSHNYQGGYVQLSYFLSDIGRNYDNGILKQADESGWELTSRYSQFNMQQENKQAKVYSVGVNYLMNKKMKIMANLTKAKQYVDNKLTLNGNAVSLRLQYAF